MFPTACLRCSIGSKRGSARLKHAIFYNPKGRITSCELPTLRTAQPNKAGTTAFRALSTNFNRQERAQAAESEIWSLVNDVHMVAVATHEIITRLYRKI